jgi:hypothetical protein
MWKAIAEFLFKIVAALTLWAATKESAKNEDDAKAWEKRANAEDILRRMSDDARRERLRKWSKPE